MPEGIGYDEMTSTLTAQDEADERKREAEKIKAQNEALITSWAEKIKRARKHDSVARKQWADDRRVAKGESVWLVATNLIGAILEVLAAFLYAKNPDISIRPSASVSYRAKETDESSQRLKQYRLVSETLEVMVSRMLKDAGLKRVAKRWVRAAMTVGVSWVKVAMQTRTERDPLTEKEINDLQNNLDRMEALESKLRDGNEGDPDVTEAEIRSQITALEGQLERQVAEGLVLDLMAPEDVVVSPECGEIENYHNSPWISFDMYKCKDEAIAITGWDTEKLSQANLYTQRPRKGDEEEGGTVPNANQWVSLENEDDEGVENPDGFYRFTEIWSLRDSVVYTMLDGVQGKWAREPYAPRTGSRFYPCFMLAFHPIDGERWPQSDVYQLKSLQEEYNRTRSNYAEHRRRAVPGIIFDEAVVLEESVTKLTGSQTQEYTGIKTNKPGIDMNTLFAAKRYNPVDPGLYNTEMITTEMEKVSGAQDAVTGGITTEKTATEAQILESGRGARVGARLDTLEDVLTEMSEYGTQLILLTSDKADAIRYAGPQAVWVEMSTEQALTLFNVEIKAGSTGKPAAASDREAWGTLMPLVEGLIDRVGHARMQGQEWAAEPWIELLKESSKRLDDPLEIEKFLPDVPQQVVQASTNQQPNPQDEADLHNTNADTLKKLAETLEKNPLFVSPAQQIVQEVAAGEGPPNPQQLPPGTIN